MNFVKILPKSARQKLGLFASTLDLLQTKKGTKVQIRKQSVNCTGES